MKRRTFLGAVTLGTATTAGCIESFLGDEGTLVEGEQSFSLSPGAGNTIEVRVENDGNDPARLTLVSPEMEEVLEETIEDDETIEYESEDGGDYEVIVEVERATLHFWVHRED